MAKTLQFRRDTTANLASVTGAVGEIFVDTTKDTVVVMDGSTAGGKPLATEAFVANSVSNLIDSAPGALDTLNELAAALNDDANFSTSISNTVATAGGYANSAYNQANTADQRAVTSGAYANSAYGQANTATTNATAASSYANSAYSQANTADQRAVTSGVYANSAYTQANTATVNSLSAGSYANSAYGQANTADQRAVTSGVYANSAYTQANTATVNSLSAGSYANSAYIAANNAILYTDNAIANLVNSAPITLDTLNELAAALGDDPNFATTISTTIGITGSYANSAYLQANTATTNAATADQRAVTSGTYANSAYAQANTADQRAVTSGDYANSAYAQANTAITTINAANDITTTTLYPVMVGAAGSNQTPKVRTTATDLSYNANTGSLSAAAYAIANSNYINNNRTITYYGTTHNVLGSSSGNTAIDLTLGNFVSATVAGAITWTFSNPIASPAAIGFVLELTNGGSATQTWPASVKWPGGTAPTLTVAGIDILTFITDDGGTIWRGVASMLDSK